MNQKIDTDKKEKLQSSIVQSVRNWFKPKENVVEVQPFSEKPLKKLLIIEERSCGHCTMKVKSELNEKLKKEIMAFLNNHEGGILFIWFDNSGKPAGLDDLDSLQLKISDRIKNNISPSTSELFDIVVERIEGKQVIKVFVSIELEKPDYIKRNVMSPLGCYKRV